MVSIFKFFVKLAVSSSPLLLLEGEYIRKVRVSLRLKVGDYLEVGGSRELIIPPPEVVPPAPSPAPPSPAPPSAAPPSAAKE
jgi:hypothetical protein